jgi:RNA polymerase sigma-70 factor (ECF subfamily)
LSRDNKQRFDATVLPNLNAGYNLARWLLRNDQDAEDAVQTAAIRAFQGIESYRGSDGKAWFLTIVRRSCHNLLRSKRPVTAWEDGMEDDIPDLKNPDPEQFVLREFEKEEVIRAMACLPNHLREIMVLRELEGMSYKEIAEVIEHPIGTVMSRLSKARLKLQSILLESDGGGMP